MAVTDLILQKIKEEIANDPDGLGYAGKTDAEIMALLNGNVYKQKVVIDILPSPMARIMQGIASAPNVLTDEKEVTDAKKIIAIK